MPYPTRASFPRSLYRMMATNTPNQRTGTSEQRAVGTPRRGQSASEGRGEEGGAVWETKEGSREGGGGGGRERRREERSEGDVEEIHGK